MRNFKTPMMRRFVKAERGQTLVLTALMFFALMGLSAAGLETGHVYCAYRLLRASTNAAALAGGQAMPDVGTSSDGISAGTAWGNVNGYSSISTGLNATNMLQSDAISAAFSCSTTVQSSYNLLCQTNTGTGTTCASGCNVLTVTQTAKVNLWFGGFVGVRTFNLSASAEASMRGGSNTPYNIALILDTTSSMHSDSAPSGDSCPGGDSQIQCAVYGLQTMLELLDPCALNTTCSSSSTYVDAVALFAFPALEFSDRSSDDFANEDYCGGTPTPVPYAFPNVTGTGTGTSTPTSTNLSLPYTSGATDAGSYQLIPNQGSQFDNAYKSNDETQTLNTSDYLAKAAGSGCTGLYAEGGEGTYYAQAIYAAQSALATMQSNNPGSVNVLIILSDGDANACNMQANTASGGNGSTSCENGTSEIVAINNPNNTNCSSVTVPCLNGTCPTSTTCTSNPNHNSYQYPSALGECWQSVQAAQYATSKGTRVYTVAMGSETGLPGTGGNNASCSTDRTTLSETSLSNGAETYPSGTYSGSACNAIGAMASDANKFFSDQSQSPPCKATGGNVNFTSIPSIFGAIAASLTDARLIPNGT
jgi:hypothetical protein